MPVSLKRVYVALLKEYGPQRWWPVADGNAVKPTYRSRARLTEKQRFEVCVGAILTQNTSWGNVLQALENLHRAALMSPAKLASARREKLARLIRPARYFNQKTAYLKGFARHLLKRHNGSVKKLFAQPLADARRELLSLKGVGRETADAMLLYAGGKPVFVVDAFTQRIAGRMGLTGNLGYEDLRAFFEERLPRDAALFNEFHALLDVHGQRTCLKAEPRCGACCLRRYCDYGGQAGATTLIDY